MSERPKGYNPENEEPLEFGIVEGSQGRPRIVGTPKGLEQLNELYPPHTPVEKIIRQIGNSKKQLKSYLATYLQKFLNNLSAFPLFKIRLSLESIIPITKYLKTPRVAEEIIRCAFL